MHRVTKIIIFLLSFHCGCLALKAQESTLKGRVVDSKTGTVIPFATILLKGQQGTFGVISNTDGDFQIPVSYKERIDTVIISCIGYTTKKFLIDLLLEDRIHIVRLVEAALTLAEIEIRGSKGPRITAVNIVRSAIQSIPFNYPSSLGSYLAYYRDYQLRENKYINLNEAIIEIFDEGFNANDQLTTKMALYDYKRNEKFERDTTTEVVYDNHSTKFIPGARLYHYGGNELTILRVHDAIRNHQIGSYSFVNVMAKDFVKNHNFKLRKTIFRNEIPLYQISFYSRESASGKSHLAKGNIYIEHDNYAIHKLEYTTYEIDEGEEKTLYDIHLEYTRGEASMILNYLSFNNFFNLKDPRDFEVVDMFFNRDLNALIVRFNKAPKLKLVTDVGNYAVTYRGKKQLITAARLGDTVAGEPANSVYLYFFSYFFPKNSKAITEDLKISFSNITDIEGRHVNDVHYIPVNQFREIFVQRATSPDRNVPDTLYVKKDMPLAASAIVEAATPDSNYWMNTPLKSAPEKSFVELELLEKGYK